MDREPRDLHPLCAASALGLDPETWPTDALRAIEMRGFALGPEFARAIERATRRRAVERYPLVNRCMCGTAWAGGDPRACRTCTETSSERDEPNDGGTDGCPPAAVRHVCAGVLVASLVTGTGFPYVELPLLPLGAGPIRPETIADLEEAARYLTGRVAIAREGLDEATPERGRYEIAEEVCGHLCGVPHLDPETWAVHVIDAAIDLLCDEEHHVAEVAAGIAEWVHVLGGQGARAERDSVTARARRICRAVGVRFPREDTRRGAR